MKYINILAGIRFWLIIILAFLLLVCFICFACWIFATEITEKRKIKLLKSYGCERYLKRVASVGTGAVYAWRTANGTVDLTENQISRMKYKHLERFFERSLKND